MIDVSRIQLFMQIKEAVMNTIIKMRRSKLFFIVILSFSRMLMNNWIMHKQAHRNNSKLIELQHLFSKKLNRHLW